MPFYSASNEVTKWGDKIPAVIDLAAKWVAASSMLDIIADCGYVAGTLAAINFARDAWDIWGPGGSKFEPSLETKTQRTKTETLIRNLDLPQDLTLK